METSASSGSAAKRPGGRADPSGASALPSRTIARMALDMSEPAGPQPRMRASGTPSRARTPLGAKTAGLSSRRPPDDESASRRAKTHADVAASESAAVTAAEAAAAMLPPPGAAGAATRDGA